MSADAELRTFVEAARGQLSEWWPDATAAESGELKVLAENSQDWGWLDLGEFGALGFLCSLMSELGRVACPLPVADAFIVHDINGLAATPEAVTGYPAFTIPGTDMIEAAQVVATVFTTDTVERRISIRRLVDAQDIPGLAKPEWAAVESEELGSLPMDESVERRIADIMCLAIAHRALGAAARMHRLAIDHAISRHQFGRAIGSFGAVQQRTAAGEVLVSTSEAILAEAVAAWESCDGAPALEASLQLALAVRHVRNSVIAILRGAQHTLGAIGYFDEHEGPWLFRRVQADCLIIDAWAARGTSISEALLDGSADLPDFALSLPAQQIRDEVLEVLDRHRNDSEPGTFDIESLRAECSERGIFALAWPEEFGGRPATPEMQTAVAEVMKRAGGPVDRAMSASAMLGHSIVTHGSPEQQSAFLPLIHDGRFAFCLGYSEPEAGSDLASLRTRAERDDKGWTINGQKLWTTRADTASHVWLAVRTDPDSSPRHAGISIFVVPMDTEGISISEHRALSGEISCTVFYDNVRVPDSMRVGAVNEGWKIITDALTSERLIMGGVSGSLLKAFDDVVAVLRDPDGTALGSDKCRRIEDLAADLQAARAMVLSAARTDDAKRGRMLSSVAAVFSGDLAEKLTTELASVLGPRAALGVSAAERVGSGELEGVLRLAPMYVIGGGTNDIQRSLIARLLGLPRE